jgi:hypothetical protein
MVINEAQPLIHLRRLARRLSGALQNVNRPVSWIWRAVPAVVRIWPALAAKLPAASLKTASPLPPKLSGLCVARNAKIRMVEEVISFHSNRNLPSFRDRKVFVQRCVKLRKRRPP